MSVAELPERLLQRAAHAVLADPSKSWTCTNGDVIQIVAAGLVNPHEGPDFLDTAILREGTVLIGDAEFHRRSSDWHQHAHSADNRYSTLLLHVVAINDDEPDVARWTLVIPPEDLRGALRNLKNNTTNSEVAVNELQHFALLRLLRLTAEAQTTIDRLGLDATLRALAASWLDRLARKRHHPVNDAVIDSIRAGITHSNFCSLVHAFPAIPGIDVLSALEQSEHSRVGIEGHSLRRELFLNAVLPTLCATARLDQRVVLLQWYWGAKSIHPYAVIRRRFPEQRQDYVWQQQGLLEYSRYHGRRISSCGEAIRAYGIARTVEFLDAEYAR